MEFAHQSVLLNECIDALAIKPDGIYLDGTLGGAGHSLQICRNLTTGRLIGVDRDLVALEAAKKRLYRHAKKVTLVHDNFENVGAILTALGLDRIDGMLFDLGVSSPQLDDAERGFSYMADAPLDMRMDREQSLTAYEIVNNWPREELKSILYEYGEERYAPQIAAAIERVRTDRPIETTLELVDIIRSAMPASALREKQHPAKRSFQAIRIAVNDELGAVRQGMEAAIDHLKPGGRLAVITFHSLEDRIVKNVFQDAAKGCTCPPSFPVCVCGRKPKIRILTKNPSSPRARRSRKTHVRAAQSSASQSACESERSPLPWRSPIENSIETTAPQPTTSTPGTIRPPDSTKTAGPMSNPGNMSSPRSRSASSPIAASSPARPSRPSRSSAC